MITINQFKTSKAQVDAFNECIDLCKNGYEEVFSVQQKDWWFIKMRHVKNRRTLILEYRPEWYLIREGKKILKQVSF